MRATLLFFFFILGISFCHAQEVIDTNTSEHHGTIKIKKAGTLHSVLYDDVNFRLVCRDVYGNIIDTAVVAFDLNVTVKGIAYSEQNAGSFISRPMQQRLGRLDGVIVLMFSNIQAKERDGSIVTFPAFKAVSGSGRESTDY